VYEGAIARAGFAAGCFQQSDTQKIRRSDIVSPMLAPIMYRGWTAGAGRLSDERKKTMQIGGHFDPTDVFTLQELLMRESR
jgi:hypothetical protein